MTIARDQRLRSPAWPARALAARPRRRILPRPRWLAARLSRPALDRGRAAHHGPRSPPARIAAGSSAAELGLPLVAAGDVHMHVRGRRALQDVLTAMRLGTTVDRAGYALYPNGERHLRPLARLARALSARAARGDARDRARCTLLARRAALRVSARDRARGRDAGRAGCGSSREEGERRRWPQGAPAAGRALDRARARADRGARLRGVLPHRARHRRLRARRAASSARAAARRPTPPCATASASPRSTRRACRCCSSASSRASATSRPTSTSTSSTSGARR